MALFQLYLSSDFAILGGWGAQCVEIKLKLRFYVRHYAIVQSLFQLYLSSDFAIGGFASSFINCSLISSEMLLVKTA